MPLPSLPRIRLRPLRADDLDAFHAYRRDPEVARLQGWEPASRQAAAQFIERNASAAAAVPGRWVQFAIALSSSDLLVGDLGVHVSPDQTTAEFGITITPAVQGKGFATEAIGVLLTLLFSTTPVAEVVACTDARNAPCIAALRRAGMTLTGQRDVAYKGEACTDLVFSARRPAG